MTFTCFTGFDHYYGIPYSNDMGCTDYPGYNLPMCQPCPAVKISQGAYHGHRHGKYDDALRPGTENCDKWNLAVPLYSDFDIIEQPVDLRTLASRCVWCWVSAGGYRVLYGWCHATVSVLASVSINQYSSCGLYSECCAEGNANEPR